MSESIPESGQGNLGGGTQPEPTSGGNPAWGELLSVIPEELHSQVTPHLQKWDQGVQQRFQQVQSKYKPYEDFASNGVTPEAIQTALSLAQMLETNPQYLYEQIGQHFGFVNPESSQGTPTDQGQDNLYEGLSPELAQYLQARDAEMEQMRQAAANMAQILLHQHQSTQEEAEDAEVEQMYQQIEQTDPIFAQLNQDGAAEPYINSLLMAGLSPEEALQRFHQFVDTTLKVAGRPGSPRILGPGNGMIPGQGIDIKKATPQQARQAVAAMIAQAQAAAD